MLVRRGFVHGLNIDITVGYNLRTPGHKEHMWQYLDSRKPRIVLISIPCTGMERFKALNRVTNPHAYHKSRSLSVSLGRLAGEVAYTQCHGGRHFLSDHPRGSDLYKETEWLPFAWHFDIAWC